MWRLTPSLGIKCNIRGYFLLNSLSIFSLNLSHSLILLFHQFFIIILFAFSLHFLITLYLYSLFLASLHFFYFFAIFSLLTLLSRSFLPLYFLAWFSLYFRSSLLDYLIRLCHSIPFLLSYSPFLIITIYYFHIRPSLSLRSGFKFFLYALSLQFLFSLAHHLHTLTFLSTPYLLFHFH